MKYQSITFQYYDGAIWQTFDYYYTNTQPEDQEVEKNTGQSKSGIAYQHNLHSRLVYTYDLFLKSNDPYTTTQTQQITFLRAFFKANKQRITIDSTDIDVILTNDGTIGLNQVENSRYINTVTLNFRSKNPQ